MRPGKPVGRLQLKAPVAAILCQGSRVLQVRRRLVGAAEHGKRAGLLNQERLQLARFSQARVILQDLDRTSKMVRGLHVGKELHRALPRCCRMTDGRSGKTTSERMMCKLGWRRALRLQHSERRTVECLPLRWRNLAIDRLSNEVMGKGELAFPFDEQASPQQVLSMLEDLACVISGDGSQQVQAKSAFEDRSCVQQALTNGV